MAKRKSTKGQTTIYKTYIYITKDRVTRIPMKIGGELGCSGRVNASCSTSDTRRVKVVLALGVILGGGCGFPLVFVVLVLFYGRVLVVVQLFRFLFVIVLCPVPNVVSVSVLCMFD
jgi:hypothetical protein